MPLNLKDSEDSKQPNNVKKEPILHKPKQDLTTISKIILWIVAVIVIVGGMYALIKFGLIGKKKEPITEQAITQSIDTIMTTEPPLQTTIPEQIPPSLENKPIIEKETPKKISKPKTEHNGPELKRETNKLSYREAFTIFIGSFTTKEKAEKEAARWNKEKIVVSVGEYNVMGNTVFRLCYGKYNSHEEAKNEAEKIKDKFIYGYWIGKIN